MDFAALDSNMAVKDPESGLHWYDARNLTREGKGWSDTTADYTRLPCKAEGVVRDPVWQLGQCSAGLCIRFVTDSPSLAVKWDGCKAMDHMTALGVSGLDLYVKHEGRWQWLSVGRPVKEQNESGLFSGLVKEEREFMLYLPLYNQVKKIELGIPEGAVLKPAAVRTEKPICFYGTSITQGGCASRPGMCYSAILGRRFEYPVINLGFSGNGRMEPEIISLLCELDPAVYVLDALPNMGKEEVAERAEPGIRTLKAAHPDTPVVLVENVLYCDAYLKLDRKEKVAECNKVLSDVYAKLIAEGMTGLYYLSNDGLIGTDGEGTVDGAHFTDVGYLRFSEKLGGLLEDILDC